ncbi:U3 small nucleolar RNA-associated protein 15 [Culex quinquefasciatus]|uniref:U3 small nucleolar RNA-associated protein 15 homolog n=1 Tax=Culex quinquefasciatus TaxID=7176 RepID=B0W6Q1_CULQU|nr:U3 small nucleolar RNA-associated protein 15 [Culex quinquefasciatus]|eukprot:XP_001844385.1 U3 small nucleolar RNA-associated protein 15 [Culex quinquefasciatus]
MADFKKINAQIYAKTATTFSPDTIYWKKLGVPTLVKEFGAIDYIDFSPVEPYLFAVTASVRVQIYNPVTKLVVKNITKFQEGAHCGSFRNDGNLLVAGDDLGKVRLFDVSTKSILRFFQGHKAPVHRTFFNADGHHVSSFSDDKTVRYWDIATEKHLATYSEHSDYVRAGCTSPVSPNIILSGGYDRKINMYDTRTNEKVLSLDHGSPVESLIFLPSGGIFISAGGTSVNVYDALAGGRKIAQLSQHHKTVTCLQLASEGKRLLSGSLDRHVKIYDIATYQVVHTIDNTNGVLSLGVSKNDDTLVTGMVDGLIAIHRRDSDKGKDEEEKGKARSKSRARFNNIFESADQQITDFRHDKIEQFDRMLKKYEYNRALDSVFVASVMGKTPEKTVALIKELIRRKGLQRALKDRKHSFLVKFIGFVLRHIGDYRFTPTLVDAANILLDVYEEEFGQFAGTDVGKMFINLSRRLKKEEKILNEFLEVQGLLEMISAAADLNQPALGDEEKESDLQVSLSAQKQGVISVE